MRDRGAPRPQAFRNSSRADSTLMAISLKEREADLGLAVPVLRERSDILLQQFDRTRADSARQGGGTPPRLSNQRQAWGTAGSDCPTTPWEGSMRHGVDPKRSDDRLRRDPFGDRTGEVDLERPGDAVARAIFQ